MIQKFSKLAQRIGPAAQGTNFGLCCLLCLIGCAPAKANSPRAGGLPAREPAAPSQLAAPTSNGGIEVAHHSSWDFEEVAGERTPVLVALPRAGQWQVDDRKTTWWVADNATLGMRVQVKLWPERRLATWHDCLADLGRWRKIPEQPMGSNTLQTKDMNQPQGFTSHLSVYVADRDPVKGGTGTVVLVGADIARCFAFWTDVQVPGAASNDELLARIALITEGILPKIRLRTVEQRVDGKVVH